MERRGSGPKSLTPVTAGAHWQPSSGIFAPTTGFDSRLFDDRHELRPTVREAIMERLDRCIRVDIQLAGSDWQDWTRVYIAGGSASEWAGDRPNDAAQDLDVLIGCDYESARAHSSAFRGMDDGQITTALNVAFRNFFNTNDWHPPFGGAWDLTAYCNQGSWDIAAIKPYAAYDVTGMKWAVTPPHLPEHSIADFDPAVLAEARAVAAQARAILKMPEPMRTREARSLWEKIHADRSRAFSAEGEGWQDAPNVVEKYMAYHPQHLLQRIRELALTKTAAREPGYYHGTRYSLRPGDVLIGGTHPANNPGVGKYEHVYMARSPMEARAAGGLAYDSLGYRRGEPNVYEVEPLDPTERDPFTEGAVRSKRARVLRKVDPFAEPEDEHEPKTAALADEQDGEGLIVRNRNDLGWGPDEWASARREPWHAAAQLAQRQVRLDHPRLTMRFPRSDEGGDEMVGHFLRHVGYGGDTDGAFVARHPDPSKMESNPSWLGGRPGVALHPDKWDYGTVAHEAAHHAVIYDHAAAPNEYQPDEQVHGPEWAGHYALGLNKISRGAGDDFLAHHQRYRDMIAEGLQYVRPSDMDDADRRRGLTIREGAAQNPPCRLCGEPLDDEDVDNENSAHEECAQDAWCNYHQEEHEEPGLAEQHNSTYTDWGPRLPFEHGIHRGFPVQLPDEIHQAVHDESRPTAERAETLRRHLDDNPSDGMGLQRRLTPEERYGEQGHFGVHWTDQEERAKAWGEDDYYEGHRNGGVKPYVTHVALHAKSPDWEHIEEDPDELERRHMWGFDHDQSEREVPLKVGAPVHLTGISWKRGGQDEWSRHDFAEPGRHLAAVHDEDDDMDDDGDRYVTCGQGHARHWGAYGASFLLVRHRDPDDGLHRFLLQKRAPWVDHGGTWGIPGGAIHAGEEPYEGARREAEEEMGPLPRIKLHHVVADDHGGWTAWTHIADSDDRFEPRGGGESADEHDGHGWFTASEIRHLSLHPGFAQTWDAVRRSKVNKTL